MLFACIFQFHVKNIVFEHTNMFSSQNSERCPWNKGTKIPLYSLDSWFYSADCSFYLNFLFF